MRQDIDMRGFEVVCHLGTYRCLKVSWDDEEVRQVNYFLQPYNVSVVVLDKDDRLAIFEEDARYLKFLKE